jgi:hypothetical protein
MKDVQAVKREDVTITDDAGSITIDVKPLAVDDNDEEKDHCPSFHHLSKRCKSIFIYIHGLYSKIGHNRRESVCQQEKTC